MEAGPPAAATRSTGSATIADLIGRAAELYGGAVAARCKVGGAWQDVTYAEVGDRARAVALGLVDLGVQPGERVCLLCTTRLEWTCCDFAIASAGAVAVPIYPTNSPEECEWVAADSEAVVVICENAAQVEKIVAVRARLPHLRAIVVIDPQGATGGAIALDDLVERGRAGDATELDARCRAVTRDDVFTLIYTSGTTGPPKGCVLTHGNYRRVLDMCETLGALTGEEEIYLFLPLAHSFGLLMQLLSYDVGATIAYFGGDPDQIVAELQEIRPTYFPSVPRIFEKVYRLTLGSQPPQVQARMKEAAQLGVTVRDLHAHGEAVPPELQERFDEAEESLFENVRAVFGGRVRHAVSGAAPIAREILEFFYGCGVPVFEGYGMTETSTVSTYSTAENHRFGSVGRLLPGVEGRIAPDGELLLRGPHIFAGYHHTDDAGLGAVADGWLHTGDLATIDEDGYVFITGRKKDIIITSGGKNLTPANIENDMKQSRWVSQAVMYGDRRPYPVMLVTLDEEQIVPWAHRTGMEDASIPALARHPGVHALIQTELDRANERYARAEQVKAFSILDHDLSQATGELTPTLKVKRNVVYEKYADRFEALYRGAG